MQTHNELQKSLLHEIKNQQTTGWTQVTSYFSAEKRNRSERGSPATRTPLICKYTRPVAPCKLNLKSLHTQILLERLAHLHFAPGSLCFACSTQHTGNFAVMQLALLRRIRDLQVLHLSPDTNHPKWCFRAFLQALTANYDTAVSFHILPVRGSPIAPSAGAMKLSGGTAGKQTASKWRLRHLLCSNSKRWQDLCPGSWTQLFPCTWCYFVVFHT